MVNSCDPRAYGRSYSVTVRTGARGHTPSSSLHIQAFYEPNKDRANLVVLTDALVHKVATDSGPNGTLHAKGVVFLYRGSPYVVDTRREVVLCAGCVRLIPHSL